MKRRGIILAGGSGTRLHPLTAAVSKQLMPIYDKPMIFYPLSVLMLAGIREVLIITTPHEQEAFVRLLGDGSAFGISITWAAQPRPEGLAQAFHIGRSFVGGAPSALVLGDNIFYGHGLSERLAAADTRAHGATVFGYWVDQPSAYGVAEFDAQGRCIGLEEKPARPKSNYAVTGLYFYDEQVCDLAANLKPSARGELEITDLNRLYLERQELHVEKLGRGFAWLDTGTADNLLQAANFIQTLQQRQGLQIACPEEIAFHKGWLNLAALERRAQELQKSAYGQYLQRLLKESGA